MAKRPRRRTIVVIGVRRQIEGVRRLIEGFLDSILSLGKTAEAAAVAPDTGHQGLFYARLV